MESDRERKCNTHITQGLFRLKMRSGWFGENGRGREGSMDAGGNLIIFVMQSKYSLM